MDEESSVHGERIKDQMELDQLHHFQPLLSTRLQP